MKIILTLLLFLVAISAQAQTGMFYNPDRDGEGIIVTIDGERLAFAFFTYFDPNAENVVPPTVSPPLPEVPVVLPSCTPEIKTPPPGIIPPTVSPPRPPGAGGTVDQTRYGGIPVWYVGLGAYKDGIALGDMFFHKAISYPHSFDRSLSEPYKVASFMMEANEEGFDLYLDCTRYVPSGLYMCNEVLQFNKLVIGN